MASFTAEVEAALEALGSSVASALSPVTGAEAAIEKSADAMTEVAKVVEELFAAHNTPAMIQQKESADEQAEKDKDADAVQQAEQGNLDALRIRSS